VRTFLSETTQFGPLLPFSFLVGHAVFPKQRTGDEIKSQDEKEKMSIMRELLIITATS
jgi:hypothetical protein